MSPRPQDLRCGFRLVFEAANVSPELGKPLSPLTIENATIYKNHFAKLAWNAGLAMMNE